MLGMDNNMATASHLISSFKKFPYSSAPYQGTKFAKLRKDGYRLATVYETEQLLEAIRERGKGEISGEGEAERKVVKHELVPAGEEEAYRLQDGYLLDFGTLHTFYPDTTHLFSITHKLCVSLSFSFPADTRSIKLWLPLALLHACKEEDLDEIEELVKESVCIKGNIVEMNLVPTTTEDDVVIQMQTNIKEDSASTISFQEKTTGTTSTSSGGGHDDEEEEESKSGAAVRGLALLRSGTPWLNGGNALHFCGRAGKQYAAWVLSRLEEELVRAAAADQRGGIHDTDTARRLAAKQSTMVLGQDNEGNIALSCAALVKHHDARMLEEMIVWKRGQLQHVNFLGNSPVLLAAKEGHLETLAFLLWPDYYRNNNWTHPQLHSVRETHPHYFNQLNGNNFMHYLALRHTDIDHMQHMEDIWRASVRRRFGDSIHLEPPRWMMISFFLENHMGSTAFQVGLSCGRSQFCESVLRRYQGSAADFASRALAIRDAKGRNILHLYAEGGASNEVGRLILKGLRGAEAEPTDRSLPVFQRRAKEACKIKEMIRELNEDGETPCIVALRKGHSDAFKMLMPLWEDKFAVKYRNPITKDNILHYYAMSPVDPGNVSLNECSSFSNFNSRSVQELLSSENLNHETPLICALLDYGSNYAANIAPFCWLLQQDGKINVHNLPGHNKSRSLLDLYAEKFDNEDLARELLQKLGAGEQESKAEMINKALQTALSRGHARTCDALLELGGDHNFDTEQDARDLIIKSAFLQGIHRIEDPQGMWEKLKLGDQSCKLVHSGDAESYTDALRLAVEAGNVKASEWLLDILLTENAVEAGGLDDVGRTRVEELVVDSLARGDCKDQKLWDKLRNAFDRPRAELEVQTPPSSPQPHPLLRADLSNEEMFESSRASEDCALIFLREPAGLTYMSTKCLTWMSPTSLKSFKVLAHMRRHPHYCHIFRHRQILQLAAQFQCFELFDMALQAQAHEEIQQHSCSDGDERRSGLFAKIIFRNSFSSSSRFLQVLSMRTIEKECSSFNISWKRFLNASQRFFGTSAWLWARVHLVALPGSASPIDLHNSADVGGGTIRTAEADDIESAVEGGGAAGTYTYSAKRAAGQKADLPQVLPFREQQAQRFEEVYLNNFFYRFPSDKESDEVLAMGSLLVSQAANPSTYPFQLLRKMRRPPPEVVALMLRLHKIEHDAPQFDQKLLKELLKLSVGGHWDPPGIHVHTILNYALQLYQNSSSFLTFKKFLASWTDDEEIVSVQNRTTLLHQLVVLSARRSSVGLLFPALHCFRFFQVEDSRDHTGATALHAAFSVKNETAARILLTMCPHLATLGRRSGRTALHDSVHSGSLDIVKEILCLKGENNALLDERDADGRTALHFAAASESENSMEIVKLLLAHATENGDYVALLLWASAGTGVGTADKVAKDPDVAQLLRDEMKNKPEKDLSLLKLAIDKKSNTMVRELINRGAHIKPEFRRDIEKIFETTEESDQPAKTDSLGRGPLAKGIAALLLNPVTAVPITIGVIGPWGMGKSSIMLQTEIAMTMTLIERNLVAMQPSGESFPGCLQRREGLTRKGKEVRQKLRAALQQFNATDRQGSRRSQLISFSTRIKLLFTTLQKKEFWKFWTKKNGETKDDDDKFLQEFVSHYTEELTPLYKGLVLMDREDLFQCLDTCESDQRNVIIPSFITIRYNAWLYYGEKEASSGLAFTILKELEECVNTAQWLRLCWRYAYRSDPIFFFSNFTLPFIVFIVMGGWVLWIMWKLLSLPSIVNNDALKDFRYGSLPVALVVSIWVILRNVINVIKPVSEQVVKSLNTKSLYEEKLGYHQQIIDDIKFFKKEIGEEPSFGWKCFSKVWNIMVENKDNIPLTNIKKTLIQENNLRIIIFVDDLDRCTGSTYILKILGAINLILSICSINVIIGMDKDMVEEVLKKKYEGNIESAQRFLEKIIQLPIYLSESNEQEMSTFMQDLLLGKSRSAKGDSIFLTQRSDSSTMEMVKLDASTLKEGDISIVTENHPHLCEVSQGQCSNDNMNLDDLSKAPNPDSKDSIEVIDTSNDTKDEGFNVMDSRGDSISMQPLQDGESMEPTQHLEKREGHDKLAIQFHLLIPNYTRTELETFKYLHSRAKLELRQPRNWKRLLNYHRLAWYIISQTKSEILKFFHGWKEQLIIWVFVCYNWKTEMNQIFENWKDLLKEISYKNNPMTLHQVTRLCMKNNAEQQSKKEWEALADTTFGAYDIDLNVGILFQNYRFHCSLRQLEWEDIVVVDSNN